MIPNGAKVRLRNDWSYRGTVIGTTNVNSGLMYRVRWGNGSIGIAREVDLEVYG